MRAALAFLTLTLAAAPSLAEPGSAPAPVYSAATPSAPYQTPTYTPTPHSAIEDHASTAQGDAGKAIAAVMKAYADGLLSLSQARILMAEANAREMQNRVINTQTFLERRRLLEENRKQALLESWEWEAKVAERRAQRERDVLYAAYQLPGSSLNRRTGALSWPEALERVEFASQLADIEALFEGLAAEGQQYDGMYSAPIEETCQTLRSMLWRERERLGIDWRQYLECQKFLSK